VLPRCSKKGLLKWICNIGIPFLLQLFYDFVTIAQYVCYGSSARLLSMFCYNSVILLLRGLRRGSGGGFGEVPVRSPTSLVFFFLLVDELFFATSK
jgi:hypothetical protein